MVLQKRLNYGFNGYQSPPVPRAARSVRRRGPLRKKVEENQMCAFDLLATVAGKVLLEDQNPANTSPNGKFPEKNVPDFPKEEQHDAIKLLNLDPGDREISEISLSVHDVGSRTQDQPCMETVNFISGTCSGPTYEITSSHCSDQIIFGGKKVLGSNQNGLVSKSRKLQRCSSGHVESCVPKENHAAGQIHSLHVDNVGEALVDIGSNGCSSEDHKFFGRKPPALVNSDGSIEQNLLKNHSPCSSVFPSRDKYVQVVSKDDDENSSQCTQRSSFMRRSRFSARIGDQRIRKLLASRYWRVPPKVKDAGFSDTGGEFQPAYQNRKHGYKRQRSQRIYPLKKRKLFHYCSPSNADSTTGCDGIYNSPEEATADMSTSHLANGMLSSAIDSQVKLKIKSFRVPELFIEIPKTATVGFLKQTVMEAISTLLGGGLRVGVLVQGRKIRDDSKTLFQTGISHGNHLDALGFILEPNPAHAFYAMCSDDLPSRDVARPVASANNKSAESPSMAHQCNPRPSPNYPVNSVANFIESDHDSAPSSAEVSREKDVDSSRALVTVPELNAEALAVVPPQLKLEQSEMAQRRIRRPFSVCEVEALVQAVGKLGTGRWRDVKLRAFDNVKHRTYVDLKDKWKTLVHTARISSQQRRGEPVPQELLDRVLVTHAYWSQQQAKQHLKHQVEKHLLL